MTLAWTRDMAATLAADAAALRIASGLARPEKWSYLQEQGPLRWGQTQGSGQVPYEVWLHRDRPAFRCTCPVKRPPCKHAFALLLLSIDHPLLFSASPTPTALLEWCEKLDQKSSRAARPRRDPNAQSQRLAQREARVDAAVDSLEQWLGDQVQQGIGAMNRHLERFDALAARLVDQQAPGLANLVRTLPQVIHSGPGWEARVLERLAHLFLLCRAWRRRAQLEPDLNEYIRARIGFSTERAALLTRPAVSDRWLVVGRVVEEEQSLQAARTWLWGLETRQAALLLDYAPPGQAFAEAWLPGHCFDGELVFYPRPIPLRALVKERGASHPTPLLEGVSKLTDAFEVIALHYARQPWLGPLPMLLSDVTLHDSPGGWLLRDPENCEIPLTRDFAHGWSLMALPGPLHLFGEWTEGALRPLTVQLEGALFDLGRLGSLARTGRRT